MEKYIHVVLIVLDNVDWVILIILKSHQVSFPIYLQILFILFAEIAIIYFLIQKEMYILLGIMALVVSVLATVQSMYMYYTRYQIYQPIQIISCASSSSFLIDFEGNLWSFGCNEFGQLGHGDKTNINTPKIVNTLKNIQQISYGCCGRHFFCQKLSKSNICHWE